MRRGRSTFVGVVIAVVLLLLLALVLSVRRSTPREVPIPVPNAFDSYIAAGEAITGWPEDGFDYEEVGVEELRAFVTANAASISVLDEAASQECVVVVDYEAFVVDHLAAEFDRVGHAKAGQRLVMSDGILSERDGDFVEAGDTYLKMLDAGHRFGNGGLLAHVHMARGFEMLGLRRIEKLGEKMDPAQRQQLADKLVAMKREPQSFDEIMDREAYLSRKQYGILIQLTSMNKLRKVEAAIQEAQDAETLAYYDQVIASLKR